jgi:hypothetical protein
MRHRRIRDVVAVLSLVIAGACGSDSIASSVDTPATSVSLAEALAQLSVPNVGGSPLSPGLPTGMPAFDPARCAYDASSQSFVCAPVMANSLTYKQSFTLLDASGNVQTAFSPTTTATLRASVTIGGTFVDGTDGSPSTWETQGKQDFTLSGLLGTTHTLDGTGTTTITNSGSVPTTENRIIVTSKVEKLLLPAHAVGPSAFPSSGSISVKAAWVGTNQLVFDLKITFTNDGKATVVILGATNMLTCTVTLANSATICS